MKISTEDRAMRRTHLAVAVVGVALSVAGLSFFGVSTAASVFVGALIASLNLLVLARTVRSIVEGGGASWAGVALVKFLVLLAVTYGLIDSGIVRPLALSVGFGALPLGILLGGSFGVAPDDSFPGDATGGAGIDVPHASLTNAKAMKSDHA